ncbi:MAG: serine hydroxymethyltransferase [Deltaproteobacteria bacterium]|uniref:Serine hydroxymethyltransferase n=1 Tax=Candidatus Zymogenus saltonus TaxID=2844893 RepID=A0A9D8PR05_9DELT|nr:serine hydroxymethyltransferase [Candidatus Zymogenus saltonus]
MFSTGLKECDPDVYNILEREINRQKNNIILIASENYASKAVLEASGSVMTNKYAEGYPGARYYCGCQHVDEVETIAIDRAKKLFGCEYANVQPHAGTQANLAVLFSVLDIGDTVLSMNLSHGGHLSHGNPVNLSGKLFNIVFYSVDKETERIDFDDVWKKVKEHKPKLIISGASSYPREIDFSKFGEIAEEARAMHMADIAHIGGLVVAKIHNTPVPVSDFVTTTNHKTLRGPRGGIIMCKSKYAKKIDSLVFPGSQGGPFMHIIAAKAVAFKEAMEPDFVDYQKQIVANAKAMTDVIKDRGFRLVSGGTDNHLFLIDVGHNGLTGDAAAIALDRAGITANKNVIPYDTKSPRITSGVRFGTPAVTTRGMKEDDVRIVANLICDVLDDIEDETVISKTRGAVNELLKDFPIYK